MASIVLDASQGARRFSGEYDYINRSGGTFYWADSESVSSGDNAITAGNILSRRQGSWVISASQTVVEQIDPATTATSTTIPTASVEAQDLQASTQTSYRTIFSANCRLAADQIAATLMFVEGTVAVASGGNLTTAMYLPTLYLDDADYTVGNLTPKLRCRFTLLTGATAPGTMTFICGLYPVTVAGGNDTITPTLGTVVPDSQATFTDPTASTIATANTADFALPADGAKAFGVVTNATLANNSAVTIHAQLQTRSV